VGLVPVPGSNGSEFQTEMESSVIVSLRTQIAQMQTELSHHHAHPGIAAPGKFGEREGLSAQEDTLVRELREELEGTQRTLTRTVRVLGKIQHTLREHIRHLETTGGNTPEHCGPAWHLVNVCETVVSTLEELQHQGQIGSSSVLPSRAAAALRSSLNESISGLLGGANLVPNLTEEVAALRAELEECREDLKRDEDIFAEKVKELKRCRKRIRELEVENKQLSEKHQLVQVKIILSRMVSLFRHSTDECAFDSCCSCFISLIDNSSTVPSAAPGDHAAQPTAPCAAPRGPCPQERPARPARPLPGRQRGRRDR